MPGEEAALTSWLRRIWPFGGMWALIPFVALSSWALVSYHLETWPWGDRRPLREHYIFSPVSRTDLLPILNAPGRVESSKRTIVRCEIENLSGGGSSTLLSLLPEGTPVKRGDVLATLDASSFEEMYRQQVITVEQAKASHLQAQLDYEIALLAVSEFKDGTVEETVKGMEGSIALARSDLSRAMEHLSWTKRMKEKGYSSVAQIVSEQHTVSQLGFSLERQLMSRDLFQRFTEPKTEKTLQKQVQAAATNLSNEKLRLQRQVDRLNTLKAQVDRCTIKAPHDGVLFYASNRMTVIEEGMPLRQRQELFYLPDLSEMEVQVALNESVVDRVKPGFRSRVQFEAIPDLVLEGKVVSISQIPIQPQIPMQGGGGGGGGRRRPLTSDTSWRSSNSTASTQSSNPA